MTTVPNTVSVSWRHPANASKSKQRNITPEPARAGAQDGSLIDNTTTDPGTETTMDKESKAHETSITAAGCKLRVCICGREKVTSVMGLMIHQGRKKGLREQRHGPCIDQYFLQSNQANQSSEAQQWDTKQSSQNIDTPDPEEGYTSKEMPVEEPMQPQRPPLDVKIKGHKPGVKWPKAVEKKEWETVNSDLIHILEQQGGTAEERLERMGDTIYSYGEKQFRVSKGRDGKKLPTPVKSRRQQEIERLIRERRQTKKQWKKASDAGREGIILLQVDVKSRLATLRKAENLRKRHKKKEHTRTRLSKDPFKFIKDLFIKEKSGTLKTSKQELEEHLKKADQDTKKHEKLVIPHDILPIQPPEFKLDTSPPKWKEVENMVQQARAASALGPNGVPYKLYKNAPDVLCFLCKLMRVVLEEANNT